MYRVNWAIQQYDYILSSLAPWARVVIVSFDRVELRVKKVSVWASVPAGELHYEGLKSGV